MKTVLLWIALIAVFALPVVGFVGGVWLIMSMHPGMGIGPAVVTAFSVGVPIFFQLMVVHLVRAFFKRPKGGAA